MLNWQSLKNDLPYQMVNLCNLGSEFGSIVDATDEEDLFKSKKEFRILLSSFDRLRQAFKTVVFNKASEIESIKVPTVDVTVKEEDEKKMVSLPIKRYMAKFEKDLKVFYIGIKELLEKEYRRDTFNLQFFFDIKSFEYYIYDVIEFSKKEFLSQTSPLNYEKRTEIKDKVMKAVEWKLGNLEDTSRFILENGLSEKDYVRVVGAIIWSIKSILFNEEIETVMIEEIEKKYPFLYLLIKEGLMPEINNSSRITTMEPKIRLANNPPFNKFIYALDKKVINQSFKFPTAEDHQKFWNIFLASVIRRAGLVYELKKEYEKPGGKSEIVIE